MQIVGSTVALIQGGSRAWVKFAVGLQLPGHGLYPCMDIGRSGVSILRFTKQFHHVNFVPQSNCLDLAPNIALMLKVVFLIDLEKTRVYQ